MPGLIGRVEGTPVTSDSFLMRLCKALDLSPRQLAAAIDVPYADLQPLESKYAGLVDIDRSPIWWSIMELIDKRTALLLAARHELNTKLTKDRAHRALRVSEHVKRGRLDGLREIRDDVRT